MRICALVMAGEVLLGGLGASTIARAQPVDDATRGAARTMGYSGVEAYQAGQYAAARDKLDKAYRILHAPSLGLWSARALVKTGELVEASERYLEVTRLDIVGGDTTVQKQALADAATELAELGPKIPNLTVTVEGALTSEVTVSIDGVALASELVGENRPIDPGQHKVEGVRATERVSLEITVAEGDHKALSLKFKGREAGAVVAPTSLPLTSPAPEPAPGSPRKTLSWVALGVGGVGLAVGGIAGGLALSKKHTLNNSPNCSGNACQPSEQSAVSSYNSLRTVSTVGFVAGGVLAVTGVVLLLSAPKANAGSAALWLGPNSAGFIGEF